MLNQAGVAQLALQFGERGGKRKNAGRKPNGDRAGVSHLRRDELSSRRPVHVTLRMCEGAWNLRSRRSFERLLVCFDAGKDRFGFRLCHFSVLGNHIHLIVEAADKRALARGMQGLCIRIARALNRMMGRKGRVFADRYHARVLSTPTEVRRARIYLRDNAREHALVAPGHADPFCSFTLHPRWGPPPGMEPRSWLLRKGWRRGRC